MNIQTVAEGIEQDEQAETLRLLGCELGQGFFFARPMDAQAWAGLLRTDLAAEEGRVDAPAADGPSGGLRGGDASHDAAA